MGFQRPVKAASWRNSWPKRLAEAADFPRRSARDQPWLPVVYAASVRARIATGPEVRRRVGGRR